MFFIGFQEEGIMKKLITGATGFIGSAVMRELLKQGEEVKILMRKTSSTKNIDGYEVERVYGDIRDYASMRKAMEGCDTLFFVSAHFKHWVPDIREPYDVNVGGTRATLQAAMDAGIQKVVYTSTNCTMGAHGRQITNEDGEFNHFTTGDHYSMSKYLAEVEAFKFGARGLPIVIVNPTLVIGRNDQKPTPSGMMIKTIAEGKADIITDGLVNVVDVEDVAYAIVQAAKKGKVGERYVLGGRNMTVMEFYDLVADIAGVRRPRLSVPYWLALATAKFYEKRAKATGKQPEIAVNAVKIGHMGEWFDSTKAITELGMPQTPIEATIKKAIDWFKENGYLEKR
jgi:dihydroflavonol-4-reductase